MNSPYVAVKVGVGTYALCKRSVIVSGKVKFERVGSGMSRSDAELAARLFNAEHNTRHGEVRVG